MVMLLEVELVQQDEETLKIMTFIYRHLHLMTRSSLQFEVAYWLAMTLGGAAQVAAAHCLKERTSEFRPRSLQL